MPDSGADIRKRFETAPADGEDTGTSGGAAIRKLFDTSPTQEAPPPPAETTARGVARNAVAGAMEGAGAGLDVLRDPIGNLVFRPLTTLGAAAYDFLAPHLGLPAMTPEQRADLTGDTEYKQSGNALAQAAGAGSVQPATPAERYVRAGSAGAAASLLAPPGVMPAIAGAAGGVGGQVAADYAPDWAKPYAQLGGMLLGGGAGALGAAGLLRAGEGGMNALRQATGGPVLEHPLDPRYAPGVNALSPQVAARAAENPAGPRTVVTSGPLTGEILPPAKGAATPTTSAEAKQVASQYYAVADRSNSSLTPQFTNRFIDNITAELPQTEAGKVVAGQSTTSSLLDRLQALRDKPMTLQAAQEVDEALGSLVDKEYGPRGPSKEGVKLAGIQRAFRDQIENAGPGDVAGGAEGFDALGPARKAWSQAMKMADLERIEARSKLADVPTTSVKTQIRTLLNSATKSRGYSPEEIAALKDAAERGVLGSALHVFGSRLIPIAAGAAELGTHGLTAGIAAAGTAHLLGAGMRNLEQGLQAGRLQRAYNVLGRSVPPSPQPPNYLQLPAD